MKRFILLAAILLVATMYPQPVQAQVPPALVTGGAILQNGGPSHFAMQFSGNINVMSKQDVAGTVSKQVYARGIVFLADDIDLNGDVGNQLEALSGFAIGEITLGSFFVSTGTGIMVESKDGENPVRPAIMIEGGWKPISLIRVMAGAQYIPIAGAGDLVYPYVGVGISL